MSFGLLKNDSICAFIHIQNGNSFIFLSGITRVKDVNCDSLTFEALRVNLKLSDRKDYKSNFIIETPTWLQLFNTYLHRRDFGKKKLTIEDIIKQYGDNINYIRYVKWKDVDKSIKSHITKFNYNADDCLINGIHSHHVDSKFTPDNIKI